MFSHNKRLHCPVRVSEPNPGLAPLRLEQDGGPDGQLAEAALEGAGLYRPMTAGGNSHTQSILYGGGPSLNRSLGVRVGG